MNTQLRRPAPGARQSSQVCWLALVLAMLAGAGCQQPVSQTPAEALTRSAPYGAWASPIGADVLADAAIKITDLRTFDGSAYWQESRPDEGGRLVVLGRRADGLLQQFIPDGFNARTRVHEYGGGAYLRFGDLLLFSNDADQRLYLLRDDPAAATGTASPQALTPPGYRYADCVAEPAASRVICVREDHTVATVAENGEERNEIVRIEIPRATPAGDDPGVVLVTGTDFVAYPRVSHDGSQLAWIAWNHPDMPWDSAALQVAPLDAGGLGAARQIAGGPEEAPLEPQWDQDGTLYFINDPAGWWNLYRWRDGAVSAVAPMEREFGGPLWSLGESSYALTGDGRALVRSSRDAIDQLGVLDLGSGTLRTLDLPFVAFPEVRLLDADTGIVIAQSAVAAAALVVIDLQTGAHEITHQPAVAGLSADWLAVAQPLEFSTAPGADGQPRTAHAFFYPPTNPDFASPEAEKPPLLVLIHGGPTAVTRPIHSMARTYWTSRGFALVDVNYGGSTTYGREYRRRLNGGWGIVDVQDAIAAVDRLVELGLVDPQRLAIRGGSAGGYTALAALAFTDRFSAGANYYGVSDIAALAATSHKFERLYDVSLIGPPDDALYRSRSPLYRLDGFSRPLITFQGSEDLVVPPEQSRQIVAALRARGVPAAYIEFEGEQHGFRKAANIMRAAEAELYFYGQVFGFEPADRIEPVVIDPPLGGPTGPADLVVVNADVRTVDAQRPMAQAFAVAGGRFVAIGRNEDIEVFAGPATRRVDAAGATIVPGFIDGHTHLASGGDLISGVDLFDIPDKATWLARVADRVAELAPGEWVLGGRWDYTLREGEYPTRWDLDAVAPDNPVALRDIDGHSVWVNSTALELAGITANREVPAGGEIALDLQTGTPTGILKESAMSLLQDAAGYRAAREAAREALPQTLDYASSLGITGIHEMGGLDVLARYRALAAAGGLPLRVWYGVTGVRDQATADAVLARRETDGWVSRESGPLLAVGYLKHSIDGVLSTHTAALVEPYTDLPEVTGTPFHSQRELDALVRLGSERGLPTAIHAIGDQGVRMALQAFETAGGTGLSHRIEHIELVRPADVARFRALGVMASMQPNHGAGVIGKYITERVGARDVDAYVWRDFVRAGVPLIFGSDWPTAPLAPLGQIADAVYRESPYGLHEGPWYPDQALSFDEALHAYTRGAADATDWGAEIGAIAPGRWADFVVLDGPLATIPGPELRLRKVAATYLAGRQVYPPPP